MNSTKRMQLAVQRTHERLGSRVGYSAKRRHIAIASEVAGAIILDRNLTVDIDLGSAENKEEGFATIWEYFSYHYPMDENHWPVKKPTKMQRRDSVRRHSKWLQGGFERLKDHLANDYHQVLFILPRTSEGTRKEVICTDPDYQVNPNETAKEIEEKLGFKYVKALASSFASKMELLEGKRDSFVKRIVEEANRLAKDKLPEPRFGIED